MIVLIESALTSITCKYYKENVMKLFFVFIAVLLFIIPTQIVNSQTLHGFNNNIDLTKSLYDLKSDYKNAAKVVSPNSQIYLPDTLILYTMNDTIRMSASYDSRGWNNLILTQVLYSGHWVNYELRTWTYLDATTESNLTLRQMWLNGQWQNTELDSSTYDANGNMLVHLYKYWSQGAWQDSLLSSRTYDANGHMLTNIGWVLINNQWTNSWRGTYNYDTNGNEITFWDEMWSNGQWINMDKWTYTYDTTGHMLTYLSQVWYQQWENSSLATYTYDANGYMISNLVQTWANGQWTNYTIHTYTYDANGKMLTDWLKGWTNGSWMNGSLYIYTYNTNGNMVNEVIQYWLNGLWTNFYQTIYTYDSNGNIITGNNTTWTGSTWVPSDNTFVIPFIGGDYSFTGYSINIAYILINTTDVSPDLNSIVRDYSLSQNYPNPFNPSTTISYHLPKFSQVILKIYDLLGKEVKKLVDEQQNAGNYSVIFSASNLPSGIYFYQIQAGNFIQTRKLVLLK